MVLNIFMMLYYVKIATYYNFAKSTHHFQLINISKHNSKLYKVQDG